MRRDELLDFLRSHRYAVQASVSAEGRPQAAVVGIAVSDALEIVFDTLESSRKAANLRANASIALVIGGTHDGDERTLQLEGSVDVPTGADRDRIRELYFSRFPDGRDRLAWPGLIHMRVKPSWMRYSNFNSNPPEIVEWDQQALSGLS
jgi:general stress protein 26